MLRKGGFCVAIQPLLKREGLRLGVLPRRLVATQHGVHVSMGLRPKPRGDESGDQPVYSSLHNSECVTIRWVGRNDLVATPSLASCVGEEKPLDVVVDAGMHTRSVDVTAD